MPGPHDSIVKARFANTEDAASALASFAARAGGVAYRLVVTRAVNLNLVDHKLREAHSDITFTARLEDHEVVLYVLFEHQSTQDTLMPFRLLRYVPRRTRALCWCLEALTPARRRALQGAARRARYGVAPRARCWM